MPYEDALDWLEDHLDIPLSITAIARVINPQFAIAAENELLSRGIIEEPERFERGAIEEALRSKTFGKSSRIRSAENIGKGAAQVPSRFTETLSIQRVKSFTAPSGKLILVKRDMKGNIISLGLVNKE